MNIDLLFSDLWEQSHLMQLNEDQKLEIAGILLDVTFNKAINRYQIMAPDQAVNLITSISDTDISMPTFIQGILQDHETFAGLFHAALDNTKRTFITKMGARNDV